MRVALFTNNYVPFCGGVTISVETLRRGLEARGHEPWVFAPRFPDAADDPPRVLRYPSIPASTYPEFPLAIPFARDIARISGALALRRQNIARSIHNFQLVSTELGDKDQDLTNFVDASDAVLNSFARQEASIRSALRELPATGRNSSTICVSV